MVRRPNGLSCFRAFGPKQAEAVWTLRVRWRRKRRLAAARRRVSRASKRRHHPSTMYKSRLAAAASAAAAVCAAAAISRQARLVQRSRQTRIWSRCGRRWSARQPLFETKVLPSKTQVFNRGGNASTLQMQGIFAWIWKLRRVKLPSRVVRRRQRPCILAQPPYSVEPSRLVDGSAHLPRKAPSWAKSDERFFRLSHFSTRFLRSVGRTKIARCVNCLSVI